jgi:hypothetical protein
VPVKEKAGRRPVSVSRKRKLGIFENGDAEREGESEDSYGDGEGSSRVGTTGRIWRTRRRRDGKVSLMFPDSLLPSPLGASH